MLKARLIHVVRRRAVQQAERRGEPAAVLAQLERALDPDALTIGFARRFATYKRANLMLAATSKRWPRSSTIRRCPVQFDLRGQGAPARRARQGAAAAKSRS